VDAGCGSDRLRTGDNFDYYDDSNDSRAARQPVALQGMAAGGGAALPDEHLDPEVAERPADLVVYGGSQGGAQLGVLHAIVPRAGTVGQRRDLLVQSGKPVAVFPRMKWRRG